MRIYEYIPYQMSFKSLRQVDQELKGGCMSNYIPYQMSLKSLRKVDQELQGGYMSIFFTKRLLKA